MHKYDVSILILTHGALKYTWKTLSSLKITENLDYETVIVDNDSGGFLKHMLLWWHSKGYVNKLCFMDYNSLFAEGNNIASRLAEQDSKYYLLLNSDVEIKDPLWLRKLIDSHERGITAYGVVEGNPVTRVDGYCLLIDSDIYRSFQLDDSFQWWWSVTKLQAEVLKAGHSVKGFDDHEKQLHHFGGKSGKGYKGAKGLNADQNMVISWFDENSIQVLGSIDDKYHS